MAYGHSSGLLPQEAPVMMAEKRKLVFSFLSGQIWSHHIRHHIRELYHVDRQRGVTLLGRNHLRCGVIYFP